MKAIVDTRDEKIRDIIIKQYNKYGGKWIEDEYRVSRQDVVNWKKLKSETGSLKPRSHETGRLPELSPREETKLINALLKDPYATNADLAAVVGNKISPWTAGQYVKKSNLDFQWYDEEFDVEVSFTQEVANEGVAFLKQINNIPYAKRVYVDETWASSSLKNKKAAFREVKKRQRPKTGSTPERQLFLQCAWRS